MGLHDTFKALSDPLRRQILMILREGERSAGDIASELNITPAALSYHLNLLKKADLLMEYKQKNYIYYQLNTTLFDELVMWLKQFGGEESEK
ncbi:autorepressor SdpR family transcription factor [Clostridium culturomicium]|uniref:autorepressor SdpR family transcription factor n=1 Tax=Clostridium culturomicium TaxID=1499683 RepID=UPI00058B18BC|nr:autorepressor SdpR family transcription factor [Clostridium culturomicium]